MVAKRKICIVTGTRAEYGLLQGVMAGVRNEPSLKLQIIATGAHLVSRFGHTYKIIEEDGFDIDVKIDMLLASDTPVAVTKSMGLATIGFAEAFQTLQPDLIVLLGDRYETLTAAQAALIASIPVAHIHGGEVTEGAMDESIRHAITKMSHLHFASTQEYRNRIVQMGENPDHVYVVGAPGLDHIRELELMDRNVLSASLDFQLSSPFFLMTYHPVTLAGRNEMVVLENVLLALDSFPDHQTIMTYPNADTFGHLLIERLEEYASENKGRVLLTTSLGQLKYLSAAKLADVVIGNSSSGIIEAPSLGTPTVNIGTRQKGRLAASSVIHCRETFTSIKDSIERALSSEHQNLTRQIANPYGDGKTAPRIVKCIKNIPLEDLILKPFFDVSFESAEGKNT